MENNYLTPTLLSDSATRPAYQNWQRHLIWWLSLFFTCQTLLSFGQAGKIVAGTGTAGNNPNQLHDPTNIFVTAEGVVYVADYVNNRIQRWPVGGSPITTAAGGNGAGNGANQLDQPFGVFVDGSGAVYVADSHNHRIQKWAANATSGTTVAGGNGAGSGNTQLNSPTGIYVTVDGTLYVADFLNNRVQKFPPNSTGATAGVTVAGGNNEGENANQLRHPEGVVVDDPQGTGSGPVYVADTYNHRIQRWDVAATIGVTVAGGTGSSDKGSDATHLDTVFGLYRDNSTGDIYVADGYNHRIQKFSAGGTVHSAGVTVAGGHGAGTSAEQTNLPEGVFLDSYKRIYVSEHSNNRVQRFGSCPTPVATLSSSGPITCSTLAVTLTAGTANSVIIGHTFVFSNGASQVSGITSPTTTVNQTGIYSVTVTKTSNDCESVASTTVTSNTTAPNATLSANGIVTCTNSATLIAGGGGTYAFSSGTSPTNDPTMATVSQGGVYSVIVTDTSNGCSSPATTIVQSDTSLPTSMLFTSSTPNGVNLQLTGGISYERLRVVDVVNGYQIRNVEINGTGYFVVEPAKPFSITVIGANGCRKVVEGVAP